MTREEAFEVSKRAIDRFDKSRSLQWRFNVAVWTLIVAGIYFFSKETIHIGKFYIWFFSCLFFLSHAFFVVMIQLSLVGSLLVERYIYDCLNNNPKETEINVDVKTITDKSRINRKGGYWLAFQLLTTIVLLAFFILVNYEK